MKNPKKLPGGDTLVNWKTPTIEPPIAKKPKGPAMKKAKPTRLEKR